MAKSARVAVAEAQVTPQVTLKYNPYQHAFWDALELRLPNGLRAFRRLALFSGRQGGKALALDTPLPTPGGWTTMAAVQPGDRLFDDGGHPCTVVAVSAVQIDHPCFRVTFSDHTSIVADADHQWVTWDKAARKTLTAGRRVIHRKGLRGSWPRVRPRVVTTREMLARLHVRGESNHAIPLCGPLEHPAAALPIDPYVLGVWLGDGSAGSGQITGRDLEIFDECGRRGEPVRRVLGRDLFDGPRDCVGARPEARHAVTGQFQGNGSLHSRLRALGLLGHKHLPSLYRYASVRQREDLLAGLMDTDGTVEADGRCEFMNTNVDLALGVLELARSLGFRPTVATKRATLYGKDCGVAYRVTFTPDRSVCRLPRKTHRHRGGERANRFRYVTSIVPVPSVPVKCLQVDAPSHLYLAGESMIPTHNTVAGALGCVKLARTPNQVIWACAPSYPKLHDFVMPAIAALLPPAWLAKPFSASNYEWTLTNGTLIKARSLDDVQRGRGPTLDLLWIDEAREVAPVAFKTLIPTLAIRKGATIITTTPNGFDYWYESFYHPAAEGIPGYWACKYRSFDNPAMDPEELEASRREMDPLFFQQEWEAEFVSFSGAIYGPSLVEQILERDDDIRRVIPEWPQIDPNRACIVGLDPGADHPFAAVQLIATPTGLVVIGEYEARNESTMGHARALRHLLSRDNPAQPFEPMTWAIDKSQKQMAIELAQHGIIVRGAPNEVMAGIQRVKSWILGRRLWFIKERCPRTIASLLSYRYAENTDLRGAARSEKVVKINDDLPDALRYALMTWPELPFPEAPSELRDLTPLPDSARWALEREQRMDHPDLFEDETLDTPGMLGGTTVDSGTGDFWG